MSGVEWWDGGMVEEWRSGVEWISILRYMDMIDLVNLVDGKVNFTVQLHDVFFWFCLWLDLGSGVGFRRWGWGMNMTGCRSNVPNGM